MAQQTSSRLQKYFCLLSVMVVAWVILFLGKLVLFPEPSQRLFRSASLAYESQEFEAADELSGELMALLPSDPAVLLLRARILARRNKDGAAIPLFRRVTRVDEPYATDAHLGLADHFYRGSNFPAAEKHYRRYLKNRPDDLKANKNLAFLLSFQGRTWEAIPFAAKRVAQGDFNARELIMLGLAGSHWVEDENISVLVKRRFPEHLINRLGEVKRADRDNRLEEKLDLLKDIIQSSPHVILPHALLGKYYFETNQREEFLQWHEQLPEQANSHPDIWYLRGLWEKESDNYEVAASCFLRALACSSRHAKSMFQFSQLVAMLRPEQDLNSISDLVVAASDLAYLIETLSRDINPDNTLNVVKALKISQRYWEATGWCQLMIKHADNVHWAQPELLSLAPLTDFQTPDTSIMIAKKWSELFNIVLADNSALSKNGQLDQTTHQLSAAKSSAGQIMFQDLAEGAGIRFQYYNGTTLDEGLDHFFHALGGAAVVIDYDLDEWPDLYFCQGGDWSVDNPSLTIEETNPYPDRLFRNLGNGSFLEVTEAAGLGDRRFSHGATVGDYDNDGDPDLVVANAGRNRFYTNNGDGTFTDSSELLPDSFREIEWSTSVALGDLNSDGCMDLYIVNYVDFDQVRNKICVANGYERGCYPTIFDSTQDRVYLNDNSGGWTDVTKSSGFSKEHGKGLGVVSADFDGDGKLELFVGNDTVANSYFCLAKGESQNTVSFVDLGVRSGLALNAEGIAQASMGIASGDLNHDGLLDLFVTNYSDDSNTLYLQTSAGRFSDETRRSNLRDCSYSYLGFGTQFVDVELDGDLDLILTNGHIDRERITGIPESMPPQLLINENGRFDERQSQSAGEYFTKNHLGRSLSLLDWNKDGLQDAIVTHLAKPVALLTNRSKPVGTSLSLRLIGTESNRDAIGARVKIQQEDSVQYFFLTGGDGYLSHNEKRVYVGLPRTGDVQITINWPSGAIQSGTYSAEVGELTVVESSTP